MATMEAYRYPFYAVQWHPEKASYEWDPQVDIPKSHEAVLVAQHMAAFFIQEGAYPFLGGVDRDIPRVLLL